MRSPREGSNAPRALFWVLFAVVPILGVVLSSWMASLVGWAPVLFAAALVFVVARVLDRRLHGRGIGERNQ